MLHLSCQNGRRRSDYETYVASVIIRLWDAVPSSLGGVDCKVRGFWEVRGGVLGVSELEFVGGVVKVCPDMVGEDKLGGRPAKVIATSTSASMFPRHSSSDARVIHEIIRV